MAYKIFDLEKYERGRSSTNAISLHKSGVIWITAGFYKTNIPGIGFIELFFDDEKKCIGIKPYKEQTSKSLLIKERLTAKSSKNPSYAINGKKFFKLFNIKLNETMRFIPRWNEKEELWEIDLKDPIRKESSEDNLGNDGVPKITRRKRRVTEDLPLIKKE